MYQTKMTHVEKLPSRPGKEAIHSGHFMVSHFEAEGQDDFDDLAVPIPEEEQNVQKVSTVATYTLPSEKVQHYTVEESKQHQLLSIEISLTKLFKCMTLAYRQKLTSPKWNRFKGIKLRWKDKIRLNNVIWRCWHMQFIKKQNTLVCQFASPLDVDTHVKPETTILEGKYWKRRAEAVIAEYKKWRMFHIMRLLGKGDTSVQDSVNMSDMDTVESQCSDFAANMLTDEDYLSFMSDTLFSTITSHQPFAFPDCREIARGASLADFIQPSLGPLQPNLDDFMDTLEPLQDLLLTPRLPPVPEEPSIPSEDTLYRSGMSVDSYNPQNYIAESHNTSVTMPTSQMTIHGTSSNAQLMSINHQQIKNEQIQMYDNSRLFATAELPNNMLGQQEMLPTYSQGTYDQTVSQPEAQMHGNVYNDKTSRVQYGNSQPKIIAHQENCYPKYNAALPPSQTAPETVSLLQQPVQNSKYASTVVIQGRGGFSREKPRSRMSHYTGQMTNHYQNYPQIQNQQSFESRPRPSPPQMQYLHPNVEFKSKSSPTGSRPFKLPSPPLVPVTTQQVQVSAGTSVSVGSNKPSKEQYRSHSLPLGAQLGADWLVTAPAATTTHHAHDTSATTAHHPRSRECTPGAIRMRSRSTSGAAVEAAGAVVGSSGTPRRQPPPLTSVASEPTLPQASVMLAQLLSSQHSQSLYKLNSAVEETSGGTDPMKSPVLKGQHSPIGSDIISPHHSRAQSLSPPTSPCSERGGSPREPRRTHLHAEQKRRYNIKNGFDTLQALIPHLNTNPTAKISKAAMLQKGAEYIKQLKAERQQIKEEMESLRQQIECLNNSISNCHSLLPATGAPVSRGRAGRLREMFASHVAVRTAHNWKYWLFSVVSAALVESFSSCVSCSSAADLVRTTLLWAEQHCSLVEMRPAVLNSLRVLCTTTDILTSPERLAEEARAAAASAAVKREPN
ncbi:unnamed protein product [Danaus chrysippus]|uniref:(African queen) hypothetical protein n=1 Tax=Danaus chrysippus TaxID=151541 RepID=A0A8J2REF8_9NEOP|nr:unnamed protein product [Danaus chrysippus]